MSIEDEPIKASKALFFNFEIAYFFSSKKLQIFFLQTFERKQVFSSPGLSKNFSKTIFNEVSILTQNRLFD